MVSKTPQKGPGGSPRFFTSCDAARIARNVVSDQLEDREVVLACVAKGLGLAVIAIPIDKGVVKSFAGSANLQLIRLFLRLLASRLRVFGFKSQIDTATKALEDLSEQVKSLLGEDFRIANVDDVLIRSKKGCICKDQPTILTK
jgi:hypothetical protein